LASAKSRSGIVPLALAKPFGADATPRIGRVENLVPPSELRVVGVGETLGGDALQFGVDHRPAKRAPFTDEHLSWLLASHPLQVRAGYNQFIPLFVTMTDRELFHARRWNTTSCTAPHAVRAWRCPLLYL
jgi:hypothetical protein